MKALIFIQLFLCFTEVFFELQDERQGRGLFCNHYCSPDGSGVCGYSLWWRLKPRLVESSASKCFGSRFLIGPGDPDLDSIPIQIQRGKSGRKFHVLKSLRIIWRAGGVSCSFRICHKDLRKNAYNTVSYQQIWNFCSFCDFFQLWDFWTVSGFTEKRDTDSDTMNMDPKHCWQEPLLYKQPIRYILLNLLHVHRYHISLTCPQPVYLVK
jgi:hypothetical protein